MKIELAGKTVLVTGGSSGIGAEIVRCLAEAGARVALHYHRGEECARKIAREAGDGVRCFEADLSDPRRAHELFGKVLSAFGTVHVLINNAGIFVSSPIDGGVEDWLVSWEQTLAVNLTAAGVLSHAAINHFREHAGGRIIHIASRAAFRGETEEYLAYAASKGGMVSLSRSIARSFGRYNITSFVIAPGYVRTRMTEDYLDTQGAHIIEDELSLPELTKTTDVAPIVVFIASGMMDHATGCTIDINAGSYMR